MTKNPTPLLASLFFFASILMIALYAMSDKIVHEPQNFLRTYPTKLARLEKDIDIKYNSYYVAGISNGNIYLGNVTSPFNLLVVDTALTDTTHVRLSIENMHNLKLTTYLQVKIDSPYFYMMDGAMPGIFRGRIGDWHANRFMFDSVYFNLAVPVKSSLIAIRSKSSLTMESVLGKVSNDTPHVRFEYKLLQKQVDGVFCTDGKLHYCNKLNQLVYIYNYRNEYIVYDTNLNLEYRGHTIDTFSRAQVKVAKITSESKNVLATKPQYINLESCISGHYLFVKSNLLAKNDQKDIFPDVSIVDVYDLKNNKYKLSFYVQNHQGSNGGKKMSRFEILNNKRLFAIHDHYLVVHKMKSQYF